MKLKETIETNEPENNALEYNTLENNTSDSSVSNNFSDGIIDVNNGLNSNVTVNDSNQDGLDGYFNPQNNMVGNSGYYGDSSIFTQPNAYDPYEDQPPRKLTKPEFFAREGNRKHRDRITLSAIFIYISAVIGIFAADILVKAIENLNDYMVALGGEPYDTSGFMTSQIIVSLIMVGLGIGIQMFKNRVCALIGLVGSAINVLATFSAYHKFGGWYLFLAFCYATAATFALNQRWNEYERTGKCHGVI